MGGLILGDFAVNIGWLIPEVILYMAFVAIANFTQRSYELGYAFKFLRMGLLLLTALFNVWGFALGSICILDPAFDQRHCQRNPQLPLSASALQRTRSALTLCPCP